MESPQGNPGMSSAVQQAMARRGMGPGASQAGAGALTQMSPGAAQANPLPQPGNPSDLNKASAPQAPALSPAQKYTPQNQEDMIVMALIEQLKNSGKLKSEQQKMGPAPSMPPAAGGGGYMPYGGGSPTQPMSSDMFTPPEPMKRDYFNLSMPSMANTSKQGNYPF